MTDPAPPRADGDTIRRAAALFVVAAAVVVGSWQAGRIVGPIDGTTPLPAHVPTHGSVATR